MAEAVTHSTSQMVDDDLAAIATYLKDNGGVAAPAQIGSPDQNVMRVGAVIYKDNCAASHGESDQGDSGLHPRLAGSPLVQSDNPTTLTRVVLEGSRVIGAPEAPTGPTMPPFDWRLDDARSARCSPMSANSWDYHAPVVDATTVENERASLAGAR